MYRIRVDIVNDLNSDDILEPCGPAKQAVIVRHELPHGNPHYHIFIHNDVKENTLRQRFKRKFSNLKSSDYSIKKCDEQRINEYVQYMFNTKHGNKWELIDTINFDDKLINTLMENAKKVSDDYEGTKSKKLDKPTIYDLAKEIDKAFKQQYNITNNPVEQLGKRQAPEGPEEYEEYLRLAVTICHKYSQPFEEHYLRRLVTTAITLNKKGTEFIIRKIMLKEFSQY